MKNQLQMYEMYMALSDEWQTLIAEIEALMNLKMEVLYERDYEEEWMKYEEWWGRHFEQWEQQHDRVRRKIAIISAQMQAIGWVLGEEENLDTSKVLSQSFQ